MDIDEKIPELTLTPDLSDKDNNIPQVSKQEDSALQTESAEMEKLSPAERKAVDAFAEKIDLTDSAQILQYGAAAQKNIADFSDSTLSAVRTKDMGELGDMVASLVTQLKGFDPQEEPKGIRGLFKRASNNMDAMKVRYDKAEANVDKIAQQLEKEQISLLKDVALLDQLYDKNLEYFKQLNMYILAGEKKLKEEREGTLQNLYAQAKASGLPEDAQKAKDYAAVCDRFEKKLYDLKLTRQISIQMGPQIRLVQNNDTLMAEKIQTSLINTIPLWKSQMVLALGISHSKEALEAQRAVTDMTNQLLTKNADMLKTATVETAKESERGLVDIETLQHTNESLISTLDEVLQIQSEGRQKRQEAEAQLTQIEGALREKLLEVNQ